MKRANIPRGIYDTSHLIPVCRALVRREVRYTNYRYGWSPGTVGFVMMASGAMGSLVQMALVGPIVARFGERGAVLIGAAAGAIGFACFGVAATGAGYLAAILIFAFMNLFMPGLQGLMARCLSPSEQGRLQGALQGLQSLASILGPLLFGLAFAWSILDDTAFRIPGLAYFIASALSLVVLLVAFKVERVTGRNLRRHPPWLPRRDRHALQPVQLFPLEVEHS
jgi:DHA1 family tetracycline resistance protein-like MFS transporter